MPLTWTDVEKRINENSFDDLIKLKLNIDAYRLHLKHKFDPVSVVAIGKIDPLPHQIEAFVKMMRLLRPQSGIDGRIRMLLADDVGLGKTIMIGLVMKELILRKKVHKVLIVSPSGLQIQWKEEMNDKFNEKFEIIRGQIESNPYIEENRAIISVDMGRNPEKLELLLQASWDMIIFDEAHKLKPGSLRYDLAVELSKRTKHLILASATPHDGKVENFIALVKLVDEELECSSDSGELRKFLEPLMIRRLNEDIVDFKGKKLFPKRDQPQTVNIDYSPEEREFYNRVEDYVTTYYQKAEEAEKSTAILALYILHRRVSSSIKAGLNSLKKRKIRLLEPYIDLEANKEANYLDYLDDHDEVKAEKAEEVLLGATASTGEDLKVELQVLEELIEMGERLVEEENDSKFKKLMEMVKELRKDRPEDKIIIFTEFTDTLRFLEDKLTKEGFLVSKITGGMDIEEKKEQARLFETSSHILLGTEAAGEGLNLQFANIAINYELPWNPNRLEQRIGRVYRYGQKKRVFIHNFKTAFPIDDAVLRKIHEKMDNIRAIFGDSAVDVIGSLISEKEILEIFKVARTIGSSVDKVDEILKEKLEILKEIDQFLIKERFNLINVKEMTRDISHCINNFDIERFFLSYIQQKDSADYDEIKDGQYFFSIPKIAPGDPQCLDLKQSDFTNYEFKGTFDLKNKGSYVALGHPALEVAIEDSLGYNSISLISSNEKGALITFILKFFNGLDQEVYSEPLLLLKTNREIKVLDPLMIWEMGENKSPLITKEDIEETNKLLAEVLEKPRLLIADKIKNLEQFVEQKNSKDLEMEYNFIYSEYDWKIRNLRRKREEHLGKGQNYLISGIDKKISELKSEINKLLLDNQKSKQIRWELCGPVNIALLLPFNEAYNGQKRQTEDKDFEELKKIIELKGMDVVMKYEREHDREPRDVSMETIRGYDIESKSAKQARYIEVKSFATENPIQVSSNEWRVASQLQDEYYLYVVQNALSNPDLHIIKNPYENLQKLMRKVVIEDFKMVLDKLPEDFVYAV